jgi:hypothetical protein
MFGPKRTKATPSELALALLFPVWQRSNEVDVEEVEMILRHTERDEATVQAELFCLDYWSTALGVAMGMEDRKKSAEVLAGYHFVQQLMSDSLPAHSDQVKLEAIKKWLAGQISGFRRAYPDSWRAIERTKKYVPQYSVLAKRHNEYQETMALCGADAQKGFQEVCARFATNVGAPKNPIVSATALLMLVSTVKMVRDVLPSYRVV